MTSLDPFTNTNEIYTDLILGKYVYEKLFVPLQCEIQKIQNI